MPVPTKICLYCKMPGEHTDSVQCLQATRDALRYELRVTEAASPSSTLSPEGTTA